MEDKLLKLKGFRRLDAGYRKLSGCAELGAQSSRGRSSPRAPGSAQTPRKAPLVRGGPLGTCPACPRHAPTPSLPPRETRSQSSEGHSNANPRSQRPTSPGSHGAVAGVRAGLWRRPLRGLVRDTVRPAGLAAPAQCRSLTSASRRGVHKRPPRPPVSVTREGTGPFPQPSSCRAEQTMSSATRLPTSLPGNLWQGTSTGTCTPGARRRTPFASARLSKAPAPQSRVCISR